MRSAPLFPIRLNNASNSSTTNNTNVSSSSTSNNTNVSSSWTWNNTNASISWTPNNTNTPSSSSYNYNTNSKVIAGRDVVSQYDFGLYNIDYIFSFCNRV